MGYSVEYIVYRIYYMYTQCITLQYIVYYIDSIHYVVYNVQCVVHSTE